MKNRTKIFLLILILLIAFGLGQAFKKSGDDLAATIPVTVQQMQPAATAPIFIEQPTITQPRPQPKQTPPADTHQCYVGGCSGQICSDSPDTVTTCEFSDAYSCYKTGVTTCKRQSNGQCGWTQTAELSQCLQDNPPQIQFQ